MPKTRNLAKDLALELGLQKYSKEGIGPKT
jgi:hypothetical protein